MKKLIHLSGVACLVLSGLLSPDLRAQVKEDCPDCIRDVLQPASLLLFPEFCNAPGQDTLLTITSADCFICLDANAPPEVIVEIVYISGDPDDGCLEQNLNLPLTPCDTITVLTSAHTSFRQGYAYAFAKNLAGEAIKFDQLTGNQIVLDGFRNLDWSVNAVGFKAGRDLADGALTDLDEDRVRDLNGEEYVEAPDRIIVPRFLGQDPFPNFFASHRSTLTLISLTGAQFDTTVDFAIWNDNEECFSTQVEFRCWTKRFLADISMATTQRFLKSTNHDPMEIDGWRQRETGWLYLDGRIADSTADVVIDPAVYAVLVEERAGQRTADLPWEEGCRDNGALLPLGIFAD